MACEVCHCQGSFATSSWQPPLSPFLSDHGHSWEYTSSQTSLLQMGPLASWWWWTISPRPANSFHSLVYPRPSKQQRPYSIQHSEHSASSKTLYLVVVHSSCPGYEKPSFNSLVCLSAYHQGTIQNQIGRQRERSRMMSASYTPAAIAIRPPVISSFLGQNMPRTQLCQPSTKLTPFQCIL